MTAQYVTDTPEWKAQNERNARELQQFLRESRLEETAPQLLSLCEQLHEHVVRLRTIYGDDAPLSAGIVSLAVEARKLVNHVEGNA